MDSKKFKKIINEYFISYGLEKKGNYYYQKSEEIIFVVGLQKSSYSNSYYINIGYVIRPLNPNLEYPKDVDGDIRDRFSFKKNGKDNDLFELENFLDHDDELLTNYLEKNLKEYLDGTLSIKGLKDFLIKNPMLLYVTKINAKKYLGYE